MIKLRCVVEHITYQNPENEWSEMNVKGNGVDNFVTLPGQYWFSTNKIRNYESIDMYRRRSV